MNENELTKRRRQLRNIVVMAFADGSLGEREVNLVADRCADLGLDEYDLQKAVEFGLGDDAALDFPSDSDEQRELLKDLIRMMAADGHLDESEKRLFAFAAAKMSVSSKDVESLISEVLGA
ncbi:TerB family tellurite resistance protein [Rubripirellula amarantea]|uniref:Tellurite resistance protein TerB n=1 Tax=Rubripirellula amarantea TaxID=2527999 RepID=A0A5C5WW82_9BACT|nr:TerB family tellurite resistance protein [Rubripirellula amarantea]MDA8744235.1 TerB family tellurite resistance protein [Rubripirellula amarantea]TWT54243.1 Tellurite resistance protein TerB [Rubripirellula amarantea]